MTRLIEKQYIDCKFKLISKSNLDISLCVKTKIDRFDID